MATVTSWIFRNGQGAPAFRYTGDIKEMPNVTWVQVTGAKWASELYGSKQPCVLHNGMLHYGEPEVVWREGDDAPCNDSCKNAKGVFCACSCKGKNHGINNRDMADALMEDEVVYIGWEA